MHPANQKNESQCELCVININNIEDASSNDLRMILIPPCGSWSLPYQNGTPDVLDFFNGTSLRDSGWHRIWWDACNICIRTDIGKYKHIMYNYVPETWYDNKQNHTKIWHNFLWCLHETIWSQISIYILYIICDYSSTRLPFAVPFTDNAIKQHPVCGFLLPIWWVLNLVILLLAEILHQLACIKPL